MHIYCLYFDSSYLPRALVTVASLRKFSADRVYCLCFDDATYEAVAGWQLADVHPVALSCVEFFEPRLSRAKQDRTRVEYIFTLTPALPSYLFATVEGVTHVTYLDADLWFLSSPEKILRDACKADVAILPHRFTDRLKHLEQFGLYNVSWITFSATQVGRKCLAWYLESCLAWCKDRIEGDKFADQKYLESFSRLCDKLCIISDIGAGVAPWNVEQYCLSEMMGSVLVDDVPLVFFHAQGFAHLFWRAFSSGLGPYGVSMTPDMKRLLYLPYIEEFNAAAKMHTDSNGAHRHYSLASRHGFFKSAMRVCREAISGGLVIV